MFNWADIYSQSSAEKMQLLFANRQINNWFRAEMKKLIQQFRAEIKAFENEPRITSKERCKLFIKIATSIYNIYPEVLIKQVKCVSNTIIQKKPFNNN